MAKTAISTSMLATEAMRCLIAAGAAPATNGTDHIAQYFVDFQIPVRASFKAVSDRIGVSIRDLLTKTAGRRFLPAPGLPAGVVGEIVNVDGLSLRLIETIEILTCSRRARIDIRCAAR